MEVENLLSTGYRAYCRTVAPCPPSAEIVIDSLAF